MELKECYSACRDNVRSRDPDRYLSAILASEEQQDHLMALYAFNLELAKIRHLVSEPMLGEIRLQWWREVIDQVYGEQPVRKHEVALALADTIQKKNLPREPFDETISARGIEFYEAPFSGEISAPQYLVQSEGVLLLLALMILGEEGSAELNSRAEDFSRLKLRTQAENGDIFAQKFCKAENHEVSLGHLKFPAAVAPAVLHFSLAPLYQRRSLPGDFQRKWCMLKANLLGRL